MNYLKNFRCCPDSSSPISASPRLLFLLLALLLTSACAPEPISPPVNPSALEPHSPAAAHLASLWWVMLAFGAVIWVLVIGLMFTLIYLPWRSWRRFQTEKPTANAQVLHDTEKDRRPLLAFIVMMLNSFFFRFVIAAFVPIFALRACGQG